MKYQKLMKTFGICIKNGNCFKTSNACITYQNEIGCIECQTGYYIKNISYNNEKEINDISKKYIHQFHVFIST